MSDTNWLGLVIGIGIGILVFLALREVFCWYFKINKIIDLLTQLVALQVRTGQVPTSNGSHDRVSTVDPAQIVICRKCGSFKSKGGYCPNCRSGWAGKKVSGTVLGELLNVVEKEKLSLEDAARTMAVCRKCEALKKRSAPCPKCGAA